MREDERVPKRVPERSFTVLLAADGKTFDSEGFSGFLEQRRQAGLDLVFMVGGPKGIDLEHCDLKLSLGPMTCRTSSPASCCWSSSTAGTRSSPGSPTTTRKSDLRHQTSDIRSRFSRAHLRRRRRRRVARRRAGRAARLERPPKPEFGDYSTNAAMLLAPDHGSAAAADRRAAWARS